MKILNIMTGPLDYSGIGMSIINYLKNMDNKKIQFGLLVPNIVEEKIKSEIINNNIKLYELQVNNNRMRQKQPFKYCRKLYKIIKNEGYDIVHAHGSSAMLFLEMYVAKLAGCKIRIAHSRNTKADHKILHTICKPFFRNSYTHAFSCGIEAGKWLFTKKDKLTIIPNGKDCKLFCYNHETRKRIREKYAIDEKIVIGHVGNFNYQKNHEFLIDIFQKLLNKNKNYFLMLVGDGKLREEIEEKVYKLGLKDSVVFLGSISNVSELMQAMDIMVFPSRFEGFPNVLIEWQIAGLPCIISDKITKEVKVTDLVQFESIEEKPEKWAEKIQNVKLKDRGNSMYIEQVKNAGYDIKENAKRLEEIYLSLM